MKTNWFEKSKINIDSADLLYANKKYCTAVHSSYYSIILLMFHVLNISIGKSESDIELERKDKSTHNWLKSNILKKLYDISNKDTAREFNDKFGAIKGLRIIADYNNVEILEPSANTSIITAKDINDILYREFRL